MKNLYKNNNTNSEMVGAMRTNRKHATSARSSSSPISAKVSGTRSRGDHRGVERRVDPAPLLTAPARRLLSGLVPAGASAIPDPFSDGRVILETAQAGISLGRGSHLRATLAELAGHDLVEAGNRPGQAVISAAGRAHWRRLEAHQEGSDAPFADQHRELCRDDRPGPDGPERLIVNAAESPLDWLRRRRDQDGSPFLDAAAYEAGERLRRDLTTAALLPSVTARWDGAIASGSAGPRDPAGAGDHVIAARQRCRKALDAVGGDFADLLVDLCGFLKGLEQIERERRWPARSGKVAVRLALRQLGRHYGLDVEARGPAWSRGVLAWTAAPAPSQEPVRSAA